jgi:hypothetical protein
MPQSTKSTKALDFTATTENKGFIEKNEKK